jgi:threonine dehydratase
MDFAAVLRARDLLTAYLPPTPMWSYPDLDAVAGTHLYVKHENTQPIGAFKVRGGLNLVAGTPEAEREAGFITYSTGNHAQSIAYGAAAFDSSCVLVMPLGANEAKVRAARGLGATVVLHGADLDEAAAHATALAAAEGLRLVSPGDEPALLAGVGTAYLEMFDAVPDLDAVLVPAGSGTGAAAACVVAAAVAPRCEVIAVQSNASRAAHDSWRAGRCLSRPNTTRHGGLATGRGFELTQWLMRDTLADFVLLDDGAIAEAQNVLASHAHTLAEGAGAAALAAVLADPARYAGRTVAVVCSGGNASAAEIAALAAPASTRDEPAPIRAGRATEPVAP